MRQHAALLLLLAAPVLADTGLHFHGSAGLADDESIRFYFADAADNGLPIYPLTIIWRAYPEQQTGYYATFFYCAEDGTPQFTDCIDDFYGAHPYPQGSPPSTGTSHKWEIAVEQGDFESRQLVSYDQWHTQALVVRDNGGDKEHRFYWNLPNVTSDVIEHTVTISGYGENTVPSEALSWGDAPWANTTSWKHEQYKGIIRGIQIYSTDLSQNDILAEVSSPLSTTSGANNIWYINLNPTPTDISDKSGNGHDPVWHESLRPALWTDLTTCPRPGFGEPNHDGDPAAAACDCNDADPATYPGAEEANDGTDNQCPGDVGYGVTDETSSESGFHNPVDKNEYSWPVQPGAVRYEVARAGTADFSVGCTTFGPFPQNFLVDPAAPGSAEIRYYMNRSFQPNLGSWGQASSMVERDVPCD